MAGTSFPDALGESGYGWTKNDDGTWSPPYVDLSNLLIDTAQIADGAVTDAKVHDVSATKLTGLLAAILALGDSSWTVPSLGANWAAYGPAPVGYRKDALGFVHLRGVIINNSGAANPAFTLPAGYRPRNELDVASSSSVTTIFTGSRSATLVEIATTGAVSIAVPGAGYYTPLDSITFYAEL